ncbi:MAG TPA: metal ABC transporter permease [Brumimicrobium sp.]|nr:metal ABC transporter permease [Brumimicrobium sp.]
MTQPQLEIQLIAAIVSVACAIPGVFLVLRKMALISDAISHSILLGIVLGFFITQDLNSPILILLACLVGVLTVVMVELIQKTKLVKEDTAIGLVFPALFSIGIILISLKANDIHLDVDSVLLGELAFAPFDRLFINEKDFGPKALWIMGSILIFTLTLLLLFYKELKLSTFDAGLSAALGFSPVLIHYSLMTVSSVTVVGAFDSVGAILVVALMIVPAATAYLLTHKLKSMLMLSVFFGLFSSIGGYWVANLLDASIAGSMATMLGVIFFTVYLFAPKKGLLANLFKEKRQKSEVQLLAFLLHLHSLNEDNDLEERCVNHLYMHFRWTKSEADNILSLAKENSLVHLDGDCIYLTEKGNDFSERAIQFITSNRGEKIEGIKEDYLLFRG